MEETVKRTIIVTPPSFSVEVEVPKEVNDGSGLDFWDWVDDWLDDNEQLIAERYSNAFASEGGYSYELGD